MVEIWLHEFRVYLGYAFVNSGFLHGLFYCLFLSFKDFPVSLVSFLFFTVYSGVFCYFSSKNYKFSGIFLHRVPTDPGKPWKTNQFYQSQGKVGMKFRNWWKLEKSGIFFYTEGYVHYFLSFLRIIIFFLFIFLMEGVKLASYFWNRAWMVIFLSNKALVCWVFDYPSYNIFLAHMESSIIMSKLLLVFPPEIFLYIFACLNEFRALKLGVRNNLSVIVCCWTSVPKNTCEHPCLTSVLCIGP